MNRTVSLSQFMPYGAPDLIAAAPRDLSRAVMASSGLAVAAFSLACWVVALLPAPQPPVVPVRPIIDIGLPPMLPPPKSPPSGAPPETIALPRQAIPVPVPESVLPEVVESPPVTPTRTGAGQGQSTAEFVQPKVFGQLPPDAEPVTPTWFADELPMAITSPEPKYPEIAKDAGVEGLVLVHVLVGKDGRVSSALVPEKFSILLLDGAAMEAARRWVFKPAYTNGKPVAVWVALRFRFSLREY